MTQDHHTEEFDVAVSGYGPAGQAVTSLLSRLGHRACVFERYPTLYGQPRLCTIDGETARIVQQAGDVARAFRVSSWCRRYDLVDAEGAPLMTVDWSGRHLCGYPGRISFYQPDVEEVMDAAARERGAEVNAGWEVVRIDQDEEWVHVSARPRGDEAATPRQIRARYLVGTDGARSFTRESVGITQKDYGFRDAFLSVDCERLRPLSDRFDVAYTVCDPGRTIAYVPIGRQRMRFEFLVNPDDDHSELLVPEAGYAFLRRFGLTEDDVRIYRQVIYPFEGKLADDWRRGRVFLAGDAAHLMPPFLGQGACSALRDSINLAWKLDLALRGVVGDALLDTYREERAPHVEVLIIGSIEIGKIACERDPEKAAARDAFYRGGDVPPPPDDPVLTTGVLHRDSDGEIAAPASALMEQGIGRYRGETGRFDDLVGWGFHLIGWEADPRTVIDGDRGAFLESINCHTVMVSNDPAVDGWFDIDRTYESWFTDHGMMAAILVRPDFTVFGGVTDLAELPGLIDDLARQLHAHARPAVAVA